MSFLRAQQVLVNQYAYLIGELFDRNDPRTVPWKYHLIRNNYQVGDTLVFLYGVDDSARRSMERRIPRITWFTLNPGNLEWIREIVELYSAADDLQGQAMAKIYEADLILRRSLSEAFELYGAGQEMLREAGVPEERISLYFSRPQLIPVSHFYPTLEEAIAGQEAELADWRPEQPGVTHVATYRAWNDFAPSAAAPVSDYVFWDSSPNHLRATVEFNISGAGRVSAVAILSMEPEDEEFHRYLRQAVLSKRFRPAMEEGRGQRLRDVQMQVLIPRNVE